MKKSLLINLQYYGGDKATANRLARLIADMEPKRRDDVDFMFSCRYDCKHDSQTLEYVGRKFAVHSHVSKRQAVGWPFACNELWFGSMTHVYDHRHVLGEFEAILCMEADDTPMAPDWLNRLIDEWRAHKSVITGHFQTAPVPHINGNCLISGSKDFLAKIRRIGSCSPSTGWDLVLAEKFRRWGWHPTPIILSEYCRPPIDEPYFKQLQESGVVLLHGVKGESGLEIAEKFFTTKPVAGGE